MAKIPNNICIFLKCRALNWYFQWIARYPYSSRLVIKQAFQDQFRSANIDLDLEHQMMYRMEKETFDHFFEALSSINSNIRKPRTDIGLIQIAKRNISSRLLLFMHNPSATTIAQSFRDCRNADRSLSGMDHNSSKSFPKAGRIDAIIQEDFSDVNVDVISTNLKSNDD